MPAATAAVRSSSAEGVETKTEQEKMLAGELHDPLWTAVVAAEQAGRTPILGDWLGHFLLAGDTAGGATLSRFFATHVFFIPALIFPFIAFHLYLVLRNGISEVPVAGRRVDPASYGRWYQDLLRREGVPFWPDAAWHDVVFAVLVVGALFALGWIVGPPELGKPPAPTILDASPRPDWYFLWYFAVLSLAPRWAEDAIIILGPLVFGLFLVLLPLVASRGERSPFRRWWSFVVVASIVITIWHFSRVGELAPWSPRFGAQPLPPEVVGQTAGPVARGARVFYDRGCEFCHRISGLGGIRGPDLSDIGGRATREQIVTRIYSGATNMPSYLTKLQGAALDDLLTFLESRSLDAAPPAPSP